MKWSGWLAAGTLVLGGCAAGGVMEAEQSSSPAPALENTWVYQCDDGYRFSARVLDAAAIVDIGVRELMLQRSEAGSGARYVMGPNEFWANGDSASFVVYGEEHEGCAGTAAADPWSRARLMDFDFRAVGQEPGWTLEIREGSDLRFSGAYGTQRIITEAPTPEPVGDATRYQVETGGVNLQIDVRAEPCTDSMSGERFSHSVRVAVNGRPMTGCGREL